MDVERLREWLSAQFTGPTVDRVTTLPGGWESDIYRLAVKHAHGEEDLVLRVYSGSGGSATAHREFAGMQHLRSAGYPVPRVVAAEPDQTVLGRPFLVMDWVPGAADRTWPEALSGPSLTEFVRLLADLHAIDPPSENLNIARRGVVETFDLWESLGEAHRGSGFVQAIDWLRRRAAALTAMPAAMLHWDFHVGNVLVAPDDTTHVVDWTQVEVNDPRFDVAWTELLIAMAVDVEAAAEFRAEYERQTQPLDDMECFEAAAALKRVFSVVISLEAGPEALGMRPEAAASMRRGLPTLAIPYRSIRSIVGVEIPEVEALLAT